ncbi:MAG: iron-sulfur cluster assembly accessory protein [Candidatus Hydrogenedentes bacterium]|nr:iron-sulfur cluster assembly accessory protein [Candidatus Hydrogenedentota bacterium]
MKGGGCSGFSYVLEFNNFREGDNVLEQDDLKFFMDRKSSRYLKGIVLDYRGGLKGKGFVFENPNASSTCGCGESFSV